eukprot:gnl/TRDRNA2_/TRDRNA2_204161_c0_seq1.p1 gnl/TRDRNA2_/TRDRNA2_204161_c0~~gnl/TRDRNA2_/TRDRNA2_204161_c0_seq1.p1  ORF type:complete len:105 (+),score=13.85 gnl/TRDRNA2_/TRDRNA2_204161_c0_seq1:572-886(+)
MRNSNRKPPDFMRCRHGQIFANTLEQARQFHVFMQDLTWKRSVSSFLPVYFQSASTEAEVLRQNIQLGLQSQEFYLSVAVEYLWHDPIQLQGPDLMAIFEGLCI